MSFFALFESSIFASTEVRAPTRTSTLAHAAVYINGRCVSRLIFSLYIYSSANDFHAVIMNFAPTIYTLNFQHVIHRELIVINL